MLRGIHASFYDLPENQFSNPTVNSPQNDSVSDAIYSSDEFRMYAYKIKRCTGTRSHDWTECPFAHRGEKAQRRDPRKVYYMAIACPAFREGSCHRGDTCEFAHGVFEYWLHPARYRTRACNANRLCQRKVCFFAHTAEQLRPETKYKCHFTYRPRMNLNIGDPEGSGMRSVGVDGASTSSPGPVSPMRVLRKEECLEEKVTDFLRSLSGLKIRDDDGMENPNGGIKGPESDLQKPNIDWISELVKEMDRSQ
ncbi:putative Zinc finger C-x8-C-x5-C-x3-H type family protein [Tripterygium wilfordii]|uniref:Putative Zinc finger C-x8-C-x5-C-x3-H type family protein n=1 Tax=Tripterygium wilfordii TaxID=458696 RepID=A0A7J7CDM5_TRIWF|nr:zinc finger CCCH domain-containing protein 54-like [Tripterygium wilfordii]KAF5732274.1 putative Zinc finger C-x8-C-x5-C-x3-H type family protein [Tripterygium wilfordii]